MQALQDPVYHKFPLNTLLKTSEVIYSLPKLIGQLSELPNTLPKLWKQGLSCFSTGSVICGYLLINRLDIPLKLDSRLNLEQELVEQHC